MLRAQSKVFLPAFLAVAFMSAPTRAETVADLYFAQVPAAGLSGPELDEAFDLALDRVLVKVTGRRVVSARASGVGPAGPLVRQYQPLAGGELRVSFDPEALRRRLDVASLPVWASNRPRTLVVLPSAPPFTDIADMSAPRVLETAAARGVPVTLASATAGGAGARDPLFEPVAAARDAGADLVLVGRPAAASGSAVLRWTLVQGDERSEWQGDVAEGVHGLADRLSARYAAAGGGRVLNVRILGIDSFDDYGRLQRYLRGVALIQSADLRRVRGGTLEYALDVRGSIGQLNDTFALQRVLVPVVPEDSAGLAYRLVKTP